MTRAAWTGSVSRRHARRTGLSLVELLIAVAIVGIVLTVVAAFFVQQANLTRDTQARNELGIRLRGVAEAIAQDFQLAGSRAIVDAAARSAYVQAVDVACTGSSGVRDECVVVTQDPDVVGGGFAATIYYVSSLMLGAAADARTAAAQQEACRRIDYLLVDSVVYRSDLRCSDPVPASLVTFEFEFANGIRNIIVDFVCDDATTVGPSADVCYGLAGGENFVREGRVRVIGASPRSAALVDEVSLAAGMPNMRPPVRFE